MDAGSDSQKLKVVWNVFGWAWSKCGFGQSSFWTLKSTVSEKWTDKINWFLARKNLCKLKDDWNFWGGYSQK